jgi:hypothetical protein
MRSIIATIKIKMLNDVTRSNDNATERATQLTINIGKERIRLKLIFDMEISMGSMGKLFNVLIFLPSNERLTAGEKTVENVKPTNPKTNNIIEMFSSTSAR